MDHRFAVQYSFLIPLLPLLGAMASGFFGARWLKGRSHWPIWISVLGSAVLSFMLLAAMVQVSSAEDGASGHGGHAQLSTSVKWFDWIIAGEPDDAGGVLRAEAGAWLDPLTAVMLCVVTGVGFLITVFAAGYMRGEDGYFRFFAYLGLFIFAMTCLVMGNNLVMLYLGWEGVGLCSYLLIGYYYEKPAAREAAKKAFLVNRVGDFGFALGIMLSFMAFGTISYFGNAAIPGDGLIEKAAALPADLTQFQQWALMFIPFLLMVGAFGKSAQFPLYVWLPDAMEGPTPVSALIHAATMVTAGVYMIARCSTLFVANSGAMIAIASVGAFTALFAASIALRQFDLKKVFAYSTISQLGYMFVAVGVLAPVAGIFHLITHAFFKALLFLSSGVVMHAMGGELDLRKMSGLKHVLPKTRWVMLIGCLALAGFPLTSGFWSKDEIVHASHARGLLLYAVLLFTAFITAYYTFRLYFRVFEGPTIVPPPDPHHGGHAGDDGHPSKGHADGGHAGDDGDASNGHTPGGGHAHNHEPALMMVPLYLLAIGALFAGVLNLPFNLGLPAHSLGHFLGQSPSFVLGYHKASAYYGPGGILGTDEPVDAVAMGQPSASAESADVVIWPLVVGGLVSLAGILLAYLLHLQDRAKAERIAARHPLIVRLLDHKYWVDEIYQQGIVESLRKLGVAFFAVDRWIVDGAVNVIGWAPQLGGWAIKLTTQRGYLQGYALTMILGVLVILWIMLG